MINTKKEELINKINNIYWKYSIEPQTVKKPQDLAVLTSICSFGKNVNRGPIAVTKCTFNNEEITLLMLGGTQFKKGQATTFKESKLASKGKENDYLKAVLKIFETKDEKEKYLIPKEKPIIITGISLGGMIAQQLLGYEEIISKFKIKSIICFGSPITKPFDRKNIRIKRFCDKNDIVPKLGETSLSTKKAKKQLDKNELILENGNYKTKIESHALSYVENTCWDKYDFYGEEKGKNELRILEKIKFYEAPIIK